MELLARVWELMVGRFEGPMSFRLILQPLTAIVLAIHAGMGDAKADRAPYLWTMLSAPGERRQLARDAWSDIGKVFIFAAVLDCVYQIKVYRWIYPAQATVVATLLAVIPYVILRGPVTRLLKRRVPH
jgi:hypothetical protein